MKICFDLDGVLATEVHHTKYAEALPIRWNIELLRRLKEHGHEIIIYSARHPEDRQVTEEWLRKHNVPYDQLVLGKPLADVYVDDRAIPANYAALLDPEEFLSTWVKTCIFLTRRCQLRCCGCNVVKYPSLEMTTEEWKRAFDIHKEWGVEFVVLFGGEPTLRNDLPELVRYLNRIDLLHTIITNSIRLVEDEGYYDKLLDARPYSISVSINVPEQLADKNLDDELKTQYGYRLLKKLLKDPRGPEDLVANMAVTHKNIRLLPKMVEHFTQMGVYTILTPIHFCPKHENGYWWYRGWVPDKIREEYELKPSDADALREVGRFFYDHYDELLLHNSRDYFKVWIEEPGMVINQSWHCSRWTCPAIDSDGRLMACIDRPLTAPYTIFDLTDRKKLRGIVKSFLDTIYGCPGCFWDHMFETHLAVAKYGKDAVKIFQHRRRWG